MKVYVLTNFNSYKELIVAAYRKEIDVSRITAKFAYPSFQDPEIKSSKKVIACIEIDDTTTTITTTSLKNVYPIQGTRDVEYYLSNQTADTLTLDEVQKGIDAIDLKKESENKLRKELDKKVVELEGEFFQPSGKKCLIAGLKTLMSVLPNLDAHVVNVNFDPLSQRIDEIERSNPGFEKEWENNESVQKLLSEAIAKDQNFMAQITAEESPSPFQKKP